MPRKLSLLLRSIPLAATLLGCLAHPARAGDSYDFDREHTTIGFSVITFGVFDMTGVFSEYDGTFMFCREHPEKDSIAVTLFSRGIHDTSGEPDDTLQGEHFFNAARFPRITFTSTALTFTGKDEADITGKLTLLGVTKPVTLHAHFLRDAADNDGDTYVVNFSATATLDRTDFGMDYLSPFPVGDEVRLSIEARGIAHDDDDDADDKR